MCCNEGFIMRVIGCHETTRTNAGSICTTKCFLSSGSENLKMLSVILKFWMGMYLKRYAKKFCLILYMQHLM